MIGLQDFYEASYIPLPEAVTGDVLLKKVLLKICEISQENTCAEVSF